jgi:hypothetical protein
MVPPVVASSEAARGPPGGRPNRSTPNDGCPDGEIFTQQCRYRERQPPGLDLRHVRHREATHYPWPRSDTTHHQTPGPLHPRVVLDGPDQRAMFHRGALATPIPAGDRLAFLGFAGHSDGLGRHTGSLVVARRRPSRRSPQLGFGNQTTAGVASSRSQTRNRPSAPNRTTPSNPAPTAKPRTAGGFLRTVQKESEPGGI